MSANVSEKLDILFCIHQNVCQVGSKDTYSDAKRPLFTAFQLEL